MKHPEVFEKGLIVKPADIDELGHVNNVVYLQWVQEVAEEHWRSRASHEQQREMIWVVLSHFIEYKKPAFERDRLLLKTYVGETSGAKSIRFVEVFRNDQLLARAKTEWCLLEASTMRPKRVGKELIEQFNEPKNG